MNVDEDDVRYNPEPGQEDAVDHVEELRSNDKSNEGDNHNIDNCVDDNSVHEPLDADKVAEGEEPNEFREDDKYQNDDPAENCDGYNLRSNRGRSYRRRLGHIMDNPASNRSYDAQLYQYARYEVKTLCEAVEEMQHSGSSEKVHKHMMGIIMTQMSARAGIKKHGQAAIDALFKEFLQLRDLGVFLPVKSRSMTNREKKGALRLISVVKEKQCGKIKGQTVADGRPQQRQYTK